MFELRAIKTGTPVVVRIRLSTRRNRFQQPTNIRSSLVPNIVNVLVSDQYTSKPIPRARLKSAVNPSPAMRVGGRFCDSPICHRARLRRAMKASGEIRRQ
jgi:hypothetical protein